MQAIQVNDINELKEDWLRLFCKQPISPFQSYPYIQLFSQQFISLDSLLLLKIIDEDKVVAIGAFEKIGDKAVLVGMKPVLGKEEITDYGDIIVDCEYVHDEKNYQDIWETIIDLLKARGIKELQLDYLRDDSHVYQYFKENSQTSIAPVEVAPWIDLNNNWDDYLTGLPRVDRKELKRKFKRLETQNYQLVELDTVKKEEFDEFIRLHRLSDSAKEKFMTDEMATFFWQVSQLSYGCWKTKLWFVEIEDKKAAAAMGFVSDDRLLMYNSGFDPQFSYYSVGLLSHALIIRKYFGSQYKIYDFMRGSERYKYDLGAKNVSLYQVVIKIY